MISAEYSTRNENGREEVAYELERGFWRSVFGLKPVTRRYEMIEGNWVNKTTGRVANYDEAFKLDIIKRHLILPLC